MICHLQFQQNLWTKNAQELLDAISSVVPSREGPDEPTPEISEDARFDGARRRVLDYLRWKRFKKVRFAALRKNVDADFADEFLNQLIIRFPDDFRASTYKGKPALSRS